jgi:hypothetical protein
MRIITISCLFVLASCAVASHPKPAPAPSPKEPAAETETAVAKRPPRTARPVAPPRVPATGIATPMKGEPGTAAQAEARLVATSCEKAKTEEVDLQIKEMRAAVDQSFKEWHDEQPACWEAMREEWREQHDFSDSSSGRLAPKVAMRSAPSSFGAGHGYGLSAAGAGTQDRKKDEPAKARSMSGTNNQVASVDEADIVKTDGRYMYFAANGALRIAEALKPRMLSVTKVPGIVRELFVEGDRAVVYTSNGVVGHRCTYAYDCAFAGDGSSTTVVVFDIRDRAAPKVARQFDLSGSLIAARRIGNAVHTVVADHDSAAPPYESWPADLEMCGTPEAQVRAKFAKLKADNERKLRAQATTFPTLTENGKSTPMCGGLMHTALRDGKAFTTVVSFDLRDDKSAPATTSLQSRPGAVFASDNALYLSVVHNKQGQGSWYSPYASVDEISEIHKFRIGDSPNETKYLGSGTVPGHVLNQFAMDEWYGYLRVATTRGRVPNPNVSSTVSILAPSANGNLVRIGAADKIAPGEDIRSVRFDGDRGYIVTFKKTDPLFVLDLFQPAEPKVLGELKIPGFSTYMHRIDPDHLLSIGFDANDHGDFAYFDGVILQLFDVKNPIDPKLVHKEKIGSRGSSSQAATDHLAFNYFANEGLLAVPMTICNGGGDGTNGHMLSFSGLLVYDVDVERGFTRLGGVDHGTKGVTCDTWWSNANSAVNRSVFVDDLVYSIADDRAKVQRLDRFGIDVADLSLK